jgi:hypothetical protein
MTFSRVECLDLFVFFSETLILPMEKLKLTGKIWAEFITLDLAVLE